MRKGLVSLTCAMLFLVSSIALSQISNLQVNGSSSTSLSMTSGDSVTWSYHVNPAGSTATVEIWYDVNANGAIDPSTDVVWQAFTQKDGDTAGYNGPSDADGLANGVVILDKTSIGLAPGKYVMRFSQGGMSIAVTPTVTALSSPAHTISGTVTVPAGASAANIFVGAEASGGHHSGPGWWALTNASGNYQIAMTADTSGGPWQVHLGTNPYPADVVTPQSREFYISGNLTAVNFSLALPAAQIAGTVKDDLGNIVPNASVGVGSMQNSQVAGGTSNFSGTYQIGLSQSDLNGNNGFRVGAYFEGENGTATMLDALATTGTIAPGDSVVKNLVSYSANSSITGIATVNGVNPGFALQLAAVNTDSGQSVTWTNETTGAFSFPVSNKIFNYTITGIGGFSLAITGQQVFHPGQSGLTINFGTTGVTASADALPTKYSLGQNYPNPFNPSTQISYNVPARSHVTLTVFNILGVKVATLVDADKAAGKYNVVFDASNLTSGVYFYRLQSGNFLQTKKMVLLK